MSTERRRTTRVGLAIPVRVQGYLESGETWDEMSVTSDVSDTGIGVPLTHAVALGHVLHLTLALPKRMRRFDETDSTYRVFALVRVVRHRAPRAHVGLMFFGKYPPRGFSQHPGGRYLMPGDPMPSVASGAVAAIASEAVTEPNEAEPAADDPIGAPPAAEAPEPETAAGTEPSPGVPPVPAVGTPVTTFRPAVDPSDRRRAPRSDRFANFTLQLTDEWGNVLQEELTVADNIGRGGARVMTSLGLQVGDVVLLQEAGGGFATRAEVRNITRAQPHVDRLHLRFVDREAPDRLLN